MSALAALSKYQGSYDQWIKIRQRYNLKWSTGNDSLTSLQRFFNPETSLDHMLKRVKEMMRVLPDHKSAVIKFTLLTGLRPSEPCESVRLLKNDCSQAVTKYYNAEQQTLEHFKFPEFFLRATKKAFISYLSTDNYHAFAKIGPKTPYYLERNKANM